MSSSTTIDASAGRPSSPEDSFTSAPASAPVRPGSLSRQRATQAMAFRQQFAAALQKHFAAHDASVPAAGERRRRARPAVCGRPRRRRRRQLPQLRATC